MLEETKLTKKESLSILLIAKLASDGMFGDSLIILNAISRKEQIKNSNHLEQSAIKFRISKLAKMRSNG